MLNTSGGVAGGDRLDGAFELRDGARATIAAQAAERFYRALPGSDAALVRNRLHGGGGACLEWLPQETILFDRCALDRRLDVDACRRRLVPRRRNAGVRPRGDGRAGRAGLAARWHPRAPRWTLAAARRGAAGRRGRCRAATRTRSPAARARWRRWCMSRRTPKRRWTTCAPRWPMRRRSRRQCLEWHAGGAYPGSRRGRVAPCGDCRVGCAARARRCRVSGCAEGERMDRRGMA